MASVSAPLVHPGAPLHLGGGSERPSLPCGSWIKTLPYKALGDGGPARLFLFFFFYSSSQNKPVSLLHTSSGERVKPPCPLFKIYIYISSTVAENIQHLWGVFECVCAEISQFSLAKL